MKMNKILAACLIFMVIAAFVMPVSVAQPINAATPFTAGPVNPKNGGALWVQDSNKLTLQLCLDPGLDPLNPLCFADPVDPLNPYSVRVGFGAEAFWWSADSSIKDRNIKFSALLVMATEFAWATEDPAPGDQFPFTRLRFRIDPPETGTYTVTHPYGVDVFEGTKGVRIFVSHDIPFTAPGPNQGKVGPFLTRVYVPPDGPAPGFISKGLNDVGPVTGSPLNTNYFEVNAVKPDGSAIDLDSTRAGVQGARTDQFSVMGQIATRHGVQVNRATYDLDPFDPGIEVFAQTFNNLTSPETINVSVAGTQTAMVNASLPDPTGIWRRYFAFIVSNAPPASITVTNTLDPAENPACLTGDTFGPSCESSVVRDLIDTVVITNAYFYRNTGELEIVASSTDPSATLTASADDGTNLGVLTGGILRIINPVPPAYVTVTSSKGGADTEPVAVGRCERAGSSLNCRTGLGNK